MRPLKILYSGQRFDYGDPARGNSFEYCNLFDSLVRMDAGAHRIVEFPTDILLKERGRAGLNRELVETAEREKPDALFAVMFQDELDGEAVRAVAARGVKTIAWFCDDHWRFWSYSRWQAPFYDWSVTTDSRAVKKYRRIGVRNVIRSQWGCNHFTYRPVTEGPEHGVTFVGQPHGNRPQMVKALGTAGIPVECWGYGWPAGRISQEEMVRVFSRSRVNLNLTNASGKIDPRSLARCVLERLPDRSIRMRTPRRMAEVFSELWGKRREQIKGRTFEIPGCGGFELCGAADDLDTWYTDGKEIAIYRSTAELVGKARYYLEHEDERARVARAGYERTLKEHTYEARFREVFRAAGLGEKRA